MDIGYQYQKKQGKGKYKAVYHAVFLIAIALAQAHIEQENIRTEDYQK